MATTISYDSSYDRTGGLQNPAGGFISATFDAAVQNMGIADVWQGLSIPAGMMVHDVGIIILTIEDSAANLTVGDAVAAAGFIATCDATVLGSAGAVNSSAFSTTFAGGKYYSSADTIDVTFASACDTVKIILYAHVSKPRV
jgi:hypothetical protein